jgi:aminopeptidase N
LKPFTTDTTWNWYIPILSESYFIKIIFQWRDEFEESVEMSTYLVAFVICDFDSISNKTAKQVEVAIHTPHGLLSQATFALQSAVQLMDYYDDFFGVPYPLPKQGIYIFFFQVF